MSFVVVVVPDRGREPGILMAGPVLFAQQRGPGPGSTGADRLAIDAGHRHDPAGRGRDQHLGCPAQVARGQQSLLHHLPRFGGELDHRAAGDACQGAADRGQPPPIHIAEHVVSRPLGNGTGGIAQHHQLGTVVVGVQQRHVQIEPVIVLDQRVHAVRRDAGHLADPQARARGLLLRRADPYERNRVAVERAPGGAQVPAAGCQPAAGTGHRHVRLAQARAADAAVQDGLDPGPVVARVQPEPGHARAEPVQVVRQPVEPPTPDMNHVIGAVRAGHTQVQDRDLRLLDRTVTPVDPGSSPRPRLLRGRFPRSRLVHLLLRLWHACVHSSSRRAHWAPGLAEWLAANLREAGTAMAETAGQDGATRTLSENDFAVGIADRYFEDYAVGAVYEYGYASVTEAEIVAFAERFDPQPIHVDTRFAASGPFGGPIASGWPTAGIAMRLIVDHYVSRVASLASPGVDELRWPNPVRPGDLLRLRTTIAETRQSRSKPDRGLVRTHAELLNQNDQTVLSLVAINLIRLRNP